MYSNYDSKKDYYAILNLAPTATSSEIKAAWKKLARKWHPDVCREAEAHHKFLEIAEAYRILSDPSERSQYDLRHRYRGSQYRSKSGPGSSFSPVATGTILDVVMTSAVNVTRLMFLSWFQVFWPTSHKS